MSRALTPADRMEVTEVAVTPDVKLLRPAIIMHLQVHMPDYIITYCMTSHRYTQVERQVASTFSR